MPAIGAFDQGLPGDDVLRLKAYRQKYINEALGQTWPAQMAKSAYSAATLPGDVYSGQVDPNSDEAIRRSADLAGMMTLGAGAVPATANELRMGIRSGTRYLHGTLADHVPSIKENYLTPDVSDYTKQFYGDDVPEAVFMAAEGDPKRAFSSIRGQIGKKLGKHPADVTADDIEKHGALIVSSGDNYDLYQMTEEGFATNKMGGHTEPLPQAEPGDWFSQTDMAPTGVLKGPRLVEFLRRRELLKPALPK
jgi:hypothetical protein